MKANNTQHESFLFSQYFYDEYNLFVLMDSGVFLLFSLPFSFFLLIVKTLFQNAMRAKVTPKHVWAESKAHEQKNETHLKTEASEKNINPTYIVQNIFSNRTICLMQ